MSTRRHLSYTQEVVAGKTKNSKRSHKERNPRESYSIRVSRYKRVATYRMEGNLQGEAQWEGAEPPPSSTEAQLDWIDRLIASKLEATGVTHREPSQAGHPAEGPTTLTAPPTDPPGTSSAVPLGQPVGPAGTTLGHSGASIMPGNTTGEQITIPTGSSQGLKKKKKNYHKVRSQGISCY